MESAHETRHFHMSQIIDCSFGMIVSDSVVQKDESLRSP